MESGNGSTVKVLKVLNLLKVLNFSGTGKTNIFTCTFIGAAAKGSDPAGLGCPLLGDGDALGLARGIHIEILVGACPSGEMPWRGLHQVVDSG